jgi:hypothetical protein
MQTTLKGLLLLTYPLLAILGAPGFVQLVS